MSCDAPFWIIFSGIDERNLAAWPGHEVSELYYCCMMMEFKIRSSPGPGPLHNIKLTSKATWFLMNVLCDAWISVTRWKLTKNAQIASKNAHLLNKIPQNVHLWHYWKMPQNINFRILKIKTQNALFWSPCAWCILRAYFSMSRINRRWLDVTWPQMWRHVTFRWSNLDLENR